MQKGLLQVIVTHKNKVARIVISLQDASGRCPAYGASSPNVRQTHNENPNS